MLVYPAVFLAEKISRQLPKGLGKCFINDQWLSRDEPSGSCALSSSGQSSMANKLVGQQPNRHRLPSCLAILTDIP
jgi:hypothetical protein